MPTKRNGKTYCFDVCSECKLICCQSANPPLTTKRKKAICAYLRHEGALSKGMFVDEAYSYPSADEKGFCTFYNKETGKCLVHPVKPETCVAGPITFDVNFETGKLELFLKKGSICAFAQKLYADNVRFKAHLEAARSEIMRLIFELEGEALKAILKIPEPETFKVAENELPKEVREKLDID